MKDGLIVSNRFLSQVWSPRPEIMWAVLTTEPSEEAIHENTAGMKQRLSSQCSEGTRWSVIQVFKRAIISSAQELSAQLQNLPLSYYCSLEAIQSTCRFFCLLFHHAHAPENTDCTEMSVNGFRPQWLFHVLWSWCCIWLLPSQAKRLCNVPLCPN